MIADHLGLVSKVVALQTSKKLLFCRVDVRWKQLQKQFIFQGTRLLCYTSCV